MNAFSFILGLTSGLAICWWQHYRSNHQLKKLLQTIPDGRDLTNSLSLISLVRREIHRLDEEKKILINQLQIWQDLLEIAPIGYLRIDEEDRLIECNQQARELLKIDRWQPGQLRLLLELVRSYQLDELIQKTRESQQPSSQQWVYRYTSSSKNQHSCALQAYSFPYLTGEVIIFLENRQALVEISQTREQAFSDLTHELRTPLTSIALVAETLEKRLENPEKRWVTQMLQETHRLINLVRDWLELTQLQKDPIQHLKYEEIELVKLINLVWQSIEPLAQEKKINLVYSGPESLTLFGDRSRLIQVFFNLFDNSIKHSANSQQIRLEIESHGKADLQFVTINIIDRGSGFLEEDLPYVFERLYRGEKSRTRSRNQGGSGLGLSIVKEIIQAHGGTIIAQNNPETQGAWLKITIPLADSQKN